MNAFAFGALPLLVALGAALTRRPAPTVLARGPELPGALAVDGAFVYWTAASGSLDRGQILKAPTQGGKPVVLATVAAPEGIAVDGAYVYFGRALEPAILKLPKGGGAAVVLASLPLAPTDIAIDETHVYWVCQGNWPHAEPQVYEPTAGPPEPAPRIEAVFRIAKGGGAVEHLATDLEGAVALALGKDEVYWLNRQGRTVQSVPKTGGTVRQIDWDPGPMSLGRDNCGPLTGADNGYPTHIVASGSELYWTRGSRNGGEIRTVRNGKAKSVRHFAGEPTGIAIGGDDIYVALSGDQGEPTGSIQLLRKSGGTPEVIADKQANLWRIALGNGSIYWTNNGGRDVMKAPLSP